MARIQIQPLADTVKHTAEKAILAMVREANRKGGYNDVRKKLEEKEAGLSSHIYALAKIASKLASSQNRGKYVPEVCVAYFQAMCKVAEQHLKDKAGEELGAPIENVKDVLPVWPVFKSNIKRNMETGADPGLYETLNAQTEARKSIEAQRANRTPGGETNQQGASDGGAAADTGTGTNIAAGVGRTKVTPALAATLSILQKRIEGMTDDEQDALAARLSEVLGEFAEKEAETPEVQEGAAVEAAGEVAKAVAEQERKSA